MPHDITKHPYQCSVWYLGHLVRLNVESGKFEYKKNLFMRFIPHERNEHDKIFNESGFYRSTIDDTPQYFVEFTRIQFDESADFKDIVFAMFYDFMSYASC